LTDLTDLEEGGEIRVGRLEFFLGSRQTEQGPKPRPSGKSRLMKAKMMPAVKFVCGRNF
jgi:hypothetical protein